MPDRITTICLPIQDVFVHFPFKLQEAIEFSIAASSAIDEFGKKQTLFETSGVDELKRPNNPHHWLLWVLAQINDYQITFFSQ